MQTLQICFVADACFAIYLNRLKEYANKTGCRIQAYVLMTNYLHLLISAERAEALGELMNDIRTALRAAF